MADNIPDIKALGIGEANFEIEGRLVCCHSLGENHRLFASRKANPADLTVFVELSEISGKLRLGGTGNTRGFRTTVVGTTPRYLRIANTSTESIGLVESLVHALCHRLSENQAGGTGDIAVQFIKEWRKLNAPSGSGQMTDRDRIGLYGELYVIEKILLPAGFRTFEVFNTWRGPHGGEQDFVHSKWSLEVKASRTKQNCKALWINGKRQLRDHGKALLLLHLHFKGDAETGDSLPGIVERLRSVVGEDSTRFETVLEGAFYRDGDPENDKLWFHCPPEETFYDVLKKSNDRQFPRIVDVNDLKAILDLKYLIELESISPFMITRVEALASLGLELPG